MSHDKTKVCIKDKKILKHNNGLITPLFKDGLSTTIINNFNYKTVTINHQMWLAENLNIETPNSKYNTEFPDYGRYYTWEDAMELVNNIPGWHIPTLEEWRYLLNSVGNNANKLRSKTNWGTIQGTDDYEFCVKPAGYYVEDNYKLEASMSNFWTSTIKQNSAFVWGITFQQSSEISEFYTTQTGNYYNIRLIRD